MPIYDYRCDGCGHAFSGVRSYTDDTVPPCPRCGAVPRRLITTPAIVFKGSGWYKTDSRVGTAAAKDSSADASKDGAKADRTETKTKTKTETKSETKTEKTETTTGGKSDTASGTKADPQPAEKKAPPSGAAS